MTPDAGTVYAIDGQPHLYVRTEDRNGTGEEHLLVNTQRRMVFQRWVREIPDEAELIIDADGRQQAEQEAWLRHAAEHEIDILVGLLRRACRMLPPERANELRQEYARTRPPKDDART